MHENFLALDREKRDRIINAALSEFSVKGFKNASTNDIVKKAGISKGLLFYYFPTKEDLFQFLYKYSMDLGMGIMGPYIENMSADVFERWSAFCVLKLETAAQYPDIAGFMLKAYKNEDAEVQDFLKTETNRFSSDFSQKIHDGIDMSKFKSDIDTQKALQMIWWVLEGYSQSKQIKSFDIAQINDGELLQTVFKEIEEYLSILKKSFYKEEYLP